MKLRCWPGALAIILRGELKGKTIECDQVSLRPDGRPQWSYKGAPLFAFVYGQLMEAAHVADDNLRPLTPPPGTVKTLTKVYLSLDPENDTIKFEEVTP